MANNKLSENLGQARQTRLKLLPLVVAALMLTMLAHSLIRERQDYRVSNERYDIPTLKTAKSAYGRWGDNGGFVWASIERMPEVVAAHYYISHHAPVSTRPGKRLRDISLGRIAQRCQENGLGELAAQIADHKILPKKLAAIGIALFDEEFKGVPNAAMLREFAAHELEGKWGPKDKRIPQQQKDFVKLAIKAQIESQNTGLEL